MIVTIIARCTPCDNATLVVQRSESEDKVDLGKDHAITCGLCRGRCTAAVIYPADRVSPRWYGDSDTFDWIQRMADFASAGCELPGDGPPTLPVFPTIEDYYAADDRRRRSGEADYGCHWRLEGWTGAWRVSYVHATGEVYAVYLGRTLPAGGRAGDGPVFLLGVVPPDPIAEGDRRSLYYATLERVLDGWPDRCGEPDGLRWIKETLARATSAPGVRR